MKNIIIFLIVSFVFNNNINSQSFEGRLEYIVNTKIIGDSVINNVSKNNLIKNLKKDGKIPNDTVTYFYSKLGDYIYISNYENVEFINTYLKKSNLIYHFVGEFNNITATNASIDIEEKLGQKPIIRILDETENIGDFKCSIIEVKWNLGTYRYYYSNILEIDPELYKNHNFDQFYNYLKISKSLPLKIEKIINNFYIITYELYSYRTEKVNRNIFDIPEMEENIDLNHIYPNKKFFTIKGNR